MSEKRRIYRIHTMQSVFVGPKEPNETFPPRETLDNADRLPEWSFEETERGILITQRNPRALSREIHDGRGATKRILTPQGQVWRTLVGWGNVRDVQYEDEPIAAPAAKPTKGAA